MSSPPYDNPIHVPAADPGLSVQIVVPARNEEDCIGRCLASLVRQQGIGFAVTVVNDSSSDGTRAIAESFSGVRVVDATEPEPGVSGKCNALIHGAKNATAKWLLFTDADTFHYPGSLARAVAEAEERGVDLLSYSPEQETGSWPEMLLLPVVFADLARTYPPRRVNDPNDPTAAANGQYLLVRREVYESLGGHKAVADKILEDVELARLFKVSHHPVWFRQGTGLVSARMYRNFPAMMAGWTKNLVLLFQNPLLLAAWRAFEFLATVGLTAAAVVAIIHGSYFEGAVFASWSLLVSGLFWSRIRQAHFPFPASLMSFFGVPMFAWLLLRSWWHMRVRGAVTWKGRTYTRFATHTGVFSAPRQPADSSIPRSSESKS